MRTIEKNSWLFRKQPPTARIRRIAGIGVAVSLMAMGVAVAQEGTPAGPAPAPGTQMSIPDGYTAHHSVDLGGRVANITGSEALYDTMVNMHSGPRVFGESFEMHALPGNKHAFVDSLSAFGSGFGGDPYNFAKLDANKGKLYEFSGLFRRDRQYFDYDLLANPSIVPNQNAIPIGNNKAPSGYVPWQSVMQSPFTFNTVRRMTDTNLTLLPLSKFAYRFGYSQNVFEGPSLSPSYTIAKYDALLQNYQRNSTDSFLGAIDWKPVETTKITFEEQVVHYKADSSFSLNPNGYQAQEADGIKVYLGNWDSQTPYGIGACNLTSMPTGTTSSNYTIFTAPQTPGGLPIISPACSAVTSYVRSLPTRVLIPTEILRLQSSTLKNVAMNGDFRYTLATTDLPSYYENALGLSTPNVRSITYQGSARGHRAVVAADFGITVEATKTISIADQVNFSSEQQPGYMSLPAGAATTLLTPGAPNQTITYGGALTAGTQAAPHGLYPSLLGYFGQSYVINNLTLNWDAAARARFAVTYRYSNHKIGEGVPHTGDVNLNTDPVSGEVEITENGGILHGAFRPANNWDINGSVEIAYADNAFTAVSPRQTKQYRIHTTYKPKTWATLNGAFNDRERHNNTFNNQADVASGDAEYYGAINHVDHIRVGSVGAVLQPSEHYGLDLSYGYTDVYTAGNVCYTSGAAATLPGTATLNANGGPNVCPGIFARGSTTLLVDFFAREFEDAPTQYGSVGLNLNPTDKVKSTVGYRVSAVNGSRFYSDARDVAGSLVSTYQSPFVNLAYTMHPGLIWKAEYNFFGYGEGGPSGAALCSTTVTATAAVVPCTSLPYPTGLTESPSGLTAPRNFHANNVMLGVHYEF